MMINDEARKKERKKEIQIYTIKNIFITLYVTRKREKGMGGTKRERERERIISVSRNMYAL